MNKFAVGINFNGDIRDIELIKQKVRTALEINSATCLNVFTHCPEMCLNNSNYIPDVTVIVSDARPESIVAQKLADAFVEEKIGSLVFVQEI